MRGLVSWWVVARAGGGYASTQGAPGTVLKVAHVCRLPCPARRRLQDLLPQAPACGTALPISCELGWLDAAASGGGGRTEGRNDEELTSQACPAGRIASGASTHSGCRTKSESCTKTYFLFPGLVLWSARENNYFSFRDTAGSVSVARSWCVAHTHTQARPSDRWVCLPPPTLGGCEEQQRRPEHGGLLQSGLPHNVRCQAC